MQTHYIIMSSSYSRGERIALHYIMDKVSPDFSVNEIVPKIVRECGEDVSLSTHFIDTESVTWDSVVKSDHFFKNVEVIDTVDEFIRLIKMDRTLTGIDVAKYILSKIKCTHLKLEKLVYFCYADYLCRYDDMLFDDTIYAYKFGPVIKSVYELCKKYGYDEIPDKEAKVIDNDETLELPSRSRILFAKNGVKKIYSIDETLKKYGDMSANRLVVLTHKNNTPWHVSGEGKLDNRIIKNEDIKEFHKYEVI